MARQYQFAYDLKLKKWEPFGNHHQWTIIALNAFKQISKCESACFLLIRYHDDNTFNTLTFRLGIKLISYSICSVVTHKNVVIITTMQVFSRISHLNTNECGSIKVADQPSNRAFRLNEFLISIINLS